jgi:hypothetical protein
MEEFKFPMAGNLAAAANLDYEIEAVARHSQLCASHAAGICEKKVQCLSSKDQSLWLVRQPAAHRSKGRVE